MNSNRNFILLDWIGKILLAFVVIVTGIHLSRLADTNKKLVISTQYLISQHQRVTEENTSLNEQQLQLLKENDRLVKLNERMIREQLETSKENNKMLRQLLQK